MKLVVHNAARHWRGNEAMVGLLVRGLLARDHVVVCSCVPGSEVERRFAALGARTTGVRPRGALDVLSAWRFSGMLERESPDALLLTNRRRMPWAAWAGARARVPRVVARLGLPEVLPARGLRRAALLRWVDRWYVPAEENKAVLVASAPGLAEAVHVVPNGVEALPAVRPAALRAELGLAADDVIVVAAGAVSARKGFDLLVRAVAGLRAGVHLVVAGDAARAGRESALAASLGVSDRVHFLGHREALSAVFAACDLYVLSSRLEGSPPVLLEAIAAGARGIVATDVAGVAAILGFERDAGRAWQRGATGWLVAPDDGAALERAVGDALALRENDPDTYAALAAAARQRVESRFTVEAMVDAVERLLFE